MQTTLLGIAIALILALVAALVGPLLIDWSHYRPVIEAEASRVVGADVRVAGAIDGRLLPSPRLTLHDVSVGQGNEAVRAGELTIQFALTPLMRGEWQAEEMRLSQPELTLGVDAAGHVQAPKIAFGFEPDALTVERLQIEGGKLVLKDAANDPRISPASRAKLRSAAKRQTILVKRKLDQDTLDEIERGRTTIVIAHRLSTVVGADQIVVLEDGRVAGGPFTA